MQGLEALEPKFNGGRTVGLDSQTIYETLKQAANNDITTSEMKDSDVVEANTRFLISIMQYGADKLYGFVTENFCEMWAPTQNQHACMEVAKKVTELPEEKIKINSMMMGESFGRRLYE